MKKEGYRSDEHPIFANGAFFLHSPRLARFRKSPTAYIRLTVASIATIS